MKITSYIEPYNAKALKATIDGTTFYFSYETMIAINCPGLGLFVRQNDWKTTTGKHLNAIDGGDKKNRLTAEEFAAKKLEVLIFTGLKDLPEITL